MGGYLNIGSSPWLGGGAAPTPAVSDQPDTFSPSDIASLVPEVGPNAAAPLQVGNLAQQISATGQYSINQQTGQLQQNLVAGISNSSLLWIVGGVFGAVVLLGAFAGGRRR